MLVRFPDFFRQFEYVHLVPKDSDLEDTAPVTPEMGTIGLKAYRSKTRGKGTRSLLHCVREDLLRGRVPEQSKKIGWHHVAYVPSVESSFPW